MTGAGQGPHWRSGGSVLDRLPPEVKLVAVVSFAAATVTVPRRQVWAFVVLAALLLATARLARVPPAELARRCLAGAPFLAVAPLLAVVAQGERMTLGPVSLSRPGTWAAWNLAAKGVLGLAATGLLRATTAPGDVIAGLDRLRVPPAFTATAGFMVRYLETTLDDARRMRAARLARADDPRWIWQAGATAATAATLFVRSYERGERVHRAMLARGYSGRLPVLDGRTAGLNSWLSAALLPAVATVVSVTAQVVER